MTHNTGDQPIFDRIVVQAETARGEAAVRSLLAGPAGFIDATMPRDAIVAAVSAATDLVLCDPLPIARVTGADRMDWLAAALPELRIGLLRVAWTESATAGIYRPRRFDFHEWAPRHGDWGRCNLVAARPSTVPASGLTVVTAPDDWPLLRPLLRRPGFGEAIRIDADGANLDEQLVRISEQLAAPPRSAIVHQATPTSQDVADRVRDVLAHHANEARVPHAQISLG